MAWDAVPEQSWLLKLRPAPAFKFEDPLGPDWVARPGGVTRRCARHNIHLHITIHLGHSLRSGGRVFKTRRILGGAGRRSRRGCASVVDRPLDRHLQDGSGHLYSVHLACLYTEARPYSNTKANSCVPIGLHTNTRLIEDSDARRAEGRHGPKPRKADA